MIKTLSKTSYVCVNAVDRIANILSCGDNYRERQQDHWRYAPRTEMLKTLFIVRICCYQWSLNTELSMWMWETLMRVFNLRNMSSMMRFLFLEMISGYFHHVSVWYSKITLIKGCKHVAVAVVGRASQLKCGWQVIKICAGREWRGAETGCDVL